MELRKPVMEAHKLVTEPHKCVMEAHHRVMELHESIMEAHNHVMESNNRVIAASRREPVMVCLLLLCRLETLYFEHDLNLVYLVSNCKFFRFFVLSLDCPGFLFL